jgi:DNA-directed RNA polymerase specialized sigma subunit
MENEYFITLEDGTNVQVTKEVYEAYYRPVCREEYYRKKEKERLLFYDGLQGADYSVESHMREENTNVQSIVEDKISLELLTCALEELSTEEYELINNIYIKEQGEREYSRISGIPRKTLAYRKENILKRLKSFFAH